VWGAGCAGRREMSQGASGAHGAKNGRPVNARTSRTGSEDSVEPAGRVTVVLSREVRASLPPPRPAPARRRSTACITALRSRARATLGPPSATGGRAVSGGGRRVEGTTSRHLDEQCSARVVLKSGGSDHLG
jgi:hypothetical protein